MQLTIETITPDSAAEMLRLNGDNRNVRKNRVLQYAESMKAGEWKLTGEAIMLNGERLLNGQHRLEACVAAGVPFTTAVARGVDAESMTVMDSGLPRSMGDVLAFRGYTNVHQTASTAKLVLAWRRGLLRDTNKMQIGISREDQLALISEHQMRFEAAVKQGGRIRRAIGLSSSVWSAAVFEMESVDQDATDLFVGRLVDGVGLTDTSPILALRNWCVNSVTLQRSRRKHELICASAKAWNAYILDKPMKMMKVLPTEDVPHLVGL